MSETVLAQIAADKTPEPSRLLKAEELQPLCDKNFGLIDRNGDGHLSPSELDGATLNPFFKGRNAQFVAAMRQNQELEELNNDEYFDEDDGPTRGDVKVLVSRGIHARTQLDLATDISIFAGADFKLVDANGDGFIDNAEIDTKLSKPNPFNEYYLKTLPVLKLHRDEIEEMHDDEWGDENDGVTVADLNAYVAHIRSKYPEVTAVDDALYQSGASLSRAEYRLFADKDNPLKSIRPEGVWQQRASDCIFLASIGSVAHSKPGLIQKMITQNSDGTFTVKFPGNISRPVTVPAPTDSELAQFAGGSNLGLYVPVLEKAFGTYRKSTGIPAMNAGEANSSEDAQEVLALLTGEATENLEPDEYSEDALHSMLSSSANYPMSVGLHAEFWSLFGFADNKDDQTGLQRTHAYSVVGYDQNTRKLTIRNPWNGLSPTTELTLAQCRSVLDRITRRVGS